MSGIIKELPMISLNNIYKSYGSDEGKVDALKNINLEIEKGEFLALCGPSGSGKSTLLNILSGIDKPTVGTVMFLKKLLNHLPEEQLAAIRGRHLGFIFQFFNLIPVLSVFDNVFFPLVLNGHVGKKKPESGRCILLRAWGLRDLPNVNRASFRAGSSSAWPSPGRWHTTRRLSLPMNRPEISIWSPGSHSGSPAEN